MKKYVTYLFAFMYVLIGVYLWQEGGGWQGPGLSEKLFTLFYAVLLWPIMMGSFVLFH